ncbi:MAG: DUF3137 domain-containing protein [Chitinophagaceae bacterium]|nr:MAG: DUF3137 domain-containing protein [Chitinophagaceae bacterium]
MLFLISAIGLYYTTEKQDVFVDDFKTKIIPKILQHISPAANYQPQKYLSKKEYKSSGLFRRRFTQYDGEDYWQANYKGLDFHCSELMVRYEDATTATTIFKGLFITAGISPYYSSGTYIWPKGDAQLAGSIADEHYRMYPMAEVQRYPIEDLSFSSHFTVYSTNFSETRQLLTGDRLKNMLVLKERTGRDVRFSFTGGKCFISLAMDEDLLEPSTSRLTDKSAYKEYFFTFLLVFNIIRELELDKLR